MGHAMRPSLIASAVALSATVALSVFAAPPAAPAAKPSSALLPPSQAGGAAPVPAPQLTKAQTDFFEGKIRPLLTAKCYKCHSVTEGKSKGGLILDTREGLLKGGEG